MTATRPRPRHVRLAARRTPAIVATLILGAALWATAGPMGIDGPVAAAAPAAPAISAAPASGAGVTASLQSQLTGYLATYGSVEHVSAVSLAVSFSTGQPDIALAAGTTQYGGGTAVSPDSLWQIGSNTKAFTSVLMLRLEAQHKLSIDDTLGQWLPQYPAWSGVTIKQLLDMTSGIPNYTDSLAFWDAVAAAPHHRFSTAQLISYAASMPATHGYFYSNTNYLLAQMIIEQASGRSYTRLLRTQLFEPLGLTDTFYTATQYGRAVTDRMPAGYWYVPLPMMSSQMGQDQRRLTISWAQAAGGIVSSLQDLGRWDHALFSGEELPRKQQRELTSLISMATAEPVHNPTLADPSAYGLGVNKVKSTALGTVWYYEGETDGYRVVNLYAPRDGTAIEIGVNSTTLTDNTGALATSVFQVLRKAGLA